MNRFLTGVAAGVAIGYLTAPRTGKEARQKLREVAEEQTEGFREQWKKSVSRTEEAFKNSMTRAGLATEPTDATNRPAADLT